jgi:hypothetical protein
MADETWRFERFPAPEGAQGAVTFLNEDARQGRGEASATVRDDGAAGLLYLEPGSLGVDTEPTWFFAAFPAPGGAQDAATFLNENPRQGRGEASATLRRDGTAGLLYLEPGSLGTSTQQAWLVVEFPGPKGAQAAVAFLNEDPRQGRGEASVTPRSDGTAGLLYLEPGSLGSGTQQAWQYKDFPGPHGDQEAIAFLNASPRQQAGEATGYVRSNGSAVIFYLEPGSGA